MAGGTNGPGYGADAMIDGINVTPLVDIMLVLLIIVMVAAQFTSSSAVPLDLPQASESDEVQTVFSVTIPGGDKLMVDGRPVGREALEARARRALEEKPDLRAVIHADGDVSHRRVMDVMDALRAAGLVRVAFATAPEDSGAGDRAGASAAESPE